MTTSPTLIGQSLPRVGLDAKVTGGAAYVQDMRLSGMLHARVVRGPSDGTTVKPSDIAAVEKMPGPKRRNTNPGRSAPSGLSRTDPRLSECSRPARCRSIKP